MTFLSEYITEHLVTAKRLHIWIKSLKSFRPSCLEITQFSKDDVWIYFTEIERLNHNCDFKNIKDIFDHFKVYTYRKNFKIFHIL